MNNESFHQRYSELSDEIRAKNKREDRLLDVRLKHVEREKNIRLNILRKQQYQVERTRLSLIEDWNKIQQDKRKQSVPTYISEKLKLDSSILQLSAPELFNKDWEPPVEIVSTMPTKKSIASTNIIRPHSAS